MAVFNTNSINSKNVNITTTGFIRDNKGAILNENCCIFLDIETVSGHKTWNEFQKKQPELAQSFKKNKTENWLAFRDTELGRIENMQKNNIQPVPYDICTEDWEYLYHLRSGLFPEYNKIVCISLLYFKQGEKKIISFANSNEEQLLIDFSIVFSGIEQQIIKETKKQPYVVGHNILLFDLPVLYKRLIMHNILPPSLIHADQVKPWEKFAVDTRNIWKAGDKNGDASLDTVCHALGIVSSKSGNHNMDGSKVAIEYYQNDNLEGIVQYCEEDVSVLHQIFTKLQNLKAYTFKV